MLEIISPDKAVQYLKQGSIIAYPTEAVYGFGCDPANHDALVEILDLKHRSNTKGMILIAADITQLEYYVDFACLPTLRYQEIKQSWPGFTTWVMPINKSNLAHINPIIYGEHNSIAVRVTSHPVVKNLCELFGGALISTSANLSGESEVRDIKQLLELIQKSKKLHSLVRAIVAGDLGGYHQPSTIKDGLTSNLIR